MTRDREFARKTIVEHESELQSTHKADARTFRILPAWYQDLKDRCLEVIKLPGFGGSMVACFAAQLYGEKMNLPDEEVMMYQPSEQWAWWFMRVQMHLSMWKVCGAPVSPEDRVKQDKLHNITLQRLGVRIDDVPPVSASQMDVGAHWRRRGEGLSHRR